MSFEQCTYSPESAGDFSPTSSLDTGQLSLLSGSLTPAKSCENEPQKDGSPACMCGKGTLGCSIHPSTPESWTAFMRDSLAKTLALLESRQAYLREPDQVFTAKSCELLAWFDRDTCTWRTLQQSFLTGSEPYLQTWPRWGTTLAGVAYEHPMSGQTIAGTDFSYWPTPVKSDALVPFGFKTMERKELGQRRPSGAYIGTQLTWDRRALPWVNGGRINPILTEWMMGMPTGWGVCLEQETPKSHCRPLPPGECSEVTE